MKSCRPWPGAVPTSTVIWVTGRLYCRRCVRSVLAEQAEEHERATRPARCGRLPAVSLLTDLDAFITDHRHCADLDAGVDGPVV